jgi:hypothetical protein
MERTVMSVSDDPRWIDRWGLWLVIVFGLLFVWMLDSFNPVSGG